MRCESVTGITKVNWAQTTSHRLGCCVFSFFFSTLLLIFFHSFLDIYYLCYTPIGRPKWWFVLALGYFFFLYTYIQAHGHTTRVTNLFLFVFRFLLWWHCCDVTQWWHHQENVQYNFGQLLQLSKVVKLLKLCKLWQLSKVRYKNF